MIFEPTPLKDAFVIRTEPIPDERGFFARTWCQQEFTAQGLNPRLVQCSTSFTTTSAVGPAAARPGEPPYSRLAPFSTSMETASSVT